MTNLPQFSRVHLPQISGSKVTPQGSLVSCDRAIKQDSWTGYVTHHSVWCIVYRATERSNPTLEERLLKADYHGSIITVTRAKCPSLVGACGIVLQETKNTLKIITKDDRLKSKCTGWYTHDWDICGSSINLSLKSSLLMFLDYFNTHCDLTHVHATCYVAVERLT